MASRVGRRLAAYAARSLRNACADSSSLQRSPLRPFASTAALGFRGTEASARRIYAPRWIPHARQMSTTSTLPQVSDPEVEKALNALYVCSWSHIDEDVEDLVEKTLAKHPNEVLLNSWRSAQAVEQFAAILNHLRLELDELSGGKFGGEDVADIPEPISKALQSAFTRYWIYLNSIHDEDEGYLKKKVELDLGTPLLQVKQRCSGLEPEWGEIAVLGTSGLAGSYIEKNAEI